MKKFLIALLAAAVLTVGCAGGGIKTRDTIPELALPAHIQRIEQTVNEVPNTSIKFVDYRDNDMTIWIWVDNAKMPEACDYVIILGVVNKSTDEYVPLAAINHNNSADPCNEAYQAYDEYTESLKAKLKNKGI